MKKIAIKRLPADDNRYKEALFNSASEIQANIIAKRRIDNSISTVDFINPTLKQIDLDSLQSYEKAARRLARAIKRSENIGICCHHSLDSTAAASLIDFALTNIFKVSGHRSQIFFSSEEKNFSHEFFKKISDSERHFSTFIFLGAPSAIHGDIKNNQSNTINAGGFCDSIALDISPEHQKTKSLLHSYINPYVTGAKTPTNTISLSIMSQILMVMLRKVCQEQGLEGGDTNLGSLTPFGACSIQGSAADIRQPIVRAFVKQGFKRMNDSGIEQWAAYRDKYLNNAELINSDTLKNGLYREVATKAFRGLSGFPLVKFLQSETLKDATRYLKLLGNDRNNQDKQEREDFIVADFMAKQKDAINECLSIYLKDAKNHMLDTVAKSLVEKYGKPVILSCPAETITTPLDVSRLKDFKWDLFSKMKTTNKVLDDGRILLVEKSDYSFVPEFSLVSSDKSNVTQISMEEAAGLSRTNLFGIKKGIYELSTSEGKVIFDLTSHRKPKLTISKVGQLHGVVRAPSSLLSYSLRAVIENHSTPMSDNGRGGYSFKCSVDSTERIRLDVEETTKNYIAETGNTLRPFMFTDGEFPTNRTLDKATLYEILALEPYGEKFPYPQYEFQAKVERMRTEKGVLELKLNFRGAGFDGIWDGFERSHLHGLIKAGEEYTFIAKPTLRMKNRRESIALMIVDAT